MPAPPVPHRLDPLGALLSYLVPGLGQVMQGRIGKGVLFFLCLYGLFFYGLYLSSWRSVWLADCRNLPEVNVPFVNKQLPGTLKDLSYRKGFVAQFFIGSAAWPAVIQYLHTEPLPTPPASGDDIETDENKWRPKPHPWFKDYMQAPSEGFINKLQSDGDKLWDLGWVYTVIAGILNILVIFDALSGPVVKEQAPDADAKPQPEPTGGAA